MITYKYKGQSYAVEHALRNAIWNDDRKILPKILTTEDWAQHGVEVKEVESVLTEEQASRQVRTKRDYLLSVSDYYVMPDYPSTEEGLTKVKAYRQALRDITKQESFPVDVVWPTKPSVLG